MKGRWIMLADICVSAVLISVFQTVGALFVIAICVAAIRFKWDGWVYGFPGILIGAFSLLFSVVAGWLPESPSQEVAPGVVLNHDYSGDHLYYVGRDVPTTYENGDPNWSGYVVRWWRWTHVVYIGGNAYDHRVSNCDVITYRTADQAALSSNKIVKLPERIEVVTITAGTDAFWRHDHYDLPQPGFEMLVAPQNGAARIEKWVFN